MLFVTTARYRCTLCGECCRGWQVPLQPGEAEAFRRAAAAVVPAERLSGAVGRATQAGVTVETLAGPGGQCVALGEDQLCRIHETPGKPRACSIFPMTFVATPTEVRVGLSWACPAVADEGAPLVEQAAEVEAVFRAAVDGTRYLLRVGETVALGAGVSLPWAQAAVLLAELDAAFAAPGPLARRICRAGAVCALVLARLGEGASFDEALAHARAERDPLIDGALAQPPAVDRLSRALFRTLLRTTEPESGAVARAGGVVAALFGASTVRLRHAGGPAEVRAKDLAPCGLGEAGEAVLAAWFAEGLRGLTFFGDAAFGLSVAAGLDLRVLEAAVAAYLARAYAAAEGRAHVEAVDVRRGLRQLEAGLTHRSNMPARFDRALEATASLDLLREQLG